MFEKARHEPGRADENFQKPSSARPTQLNAKIEQATAATEAQVAIVLAERMIKTLCAKPSNSVRPSLLNHGENPSGQIKQWAVTALPHRAPACPQKPALFACSCRIGGESSGCTVWAASKPGF
jgi:hypothetical protein